MAAIIRGNLQHSRLAQDLFRHRVNESKADLLFICERYINLQVPCWYTNHSGTAAIEMRDMVKCPATDWGRGEGFVWAKGPDATHFSFYFSSKVETSIFHCDLDALEDTIRSSEGEIIVGGYIIAKSQQ